MKRLLFITIALVSSLLSIWAGQVTREQALRHAQYFLTKKGLSRTLVQVPTGPATRSANSDAFYVFNSGKNQGFVIVSGDDRTPEILGYATSGSYESDNLPPAMVALLNHYADQIQFIQRSNAAPSPQRASHPQVVDLMTVKWDQTFPYNMYTPLCYYSNVSQGENCATGCVATAMAQVLYHQHFVDVIQAEIPGYDNETNWLSPSGVKSATLAPVPAGTAIDWANLVGHYNGSESEAQKEAVAKLMLYCGMSVKMNYSFSSSASLADVPEALKNYFGYSRGVRHLNRSRFSDESWDNIIYNEIANGRPVIYGGQTASNEGHAFIVHGYDGEGKYAINWGWGGFEDNYFLLDNLTPPHQGTGGAQSGGGYNYSQEAVIGLHREDGSFQEDVKATLLETRIGGFQKDSNNYLVIPDLLEYKASRDVWGGVPFSLMLKFTSYLANNYTFDLGYGILKSDNTLVEDVNYMRSVSGLTDNSWYSAATGTSSFGRNLSAGTYYIKGYSREYGASDWLLCEDADKYAVQLVVTDTEMSFNVVDLSEAAPIPEPTPEVTDADRETLTSLYDALKKSISDKITAVNTINSRLEDIERSLEKLDDEMRLLANAITAVETKLANEYLTDAQKVNYQSQLLTLKTQLSVLGNQLSELAMEKERLKEDNNTRSAKLEMLSENLAIEASAVAYITTKEALEASITKANELDKLQADISPTVDDLSLSTLEISLNEFSLSTLSTDIEALSSAIDAAISEAKAAEIADEAEKVRTGKAFLSEVLNALKIELMERQDNCSNYDSRMTDIEDALSNVVDYITLLEAKISAIEETLKSDILTEDQRATFNERLMTIAALKDTYRSKLSSIKESLGTVKKSVETMKSGIDEMQKKIEEQLSALEDISSSADLIAAQENVDALKEAVESVSDEDTNKVLADIENGVKNLALDDIPEILSDLEDEIKEAIASGEEELQKEEAERLVNAKESFKQVGDAFESSLSTIAGYYAEYNAAIANHNEILVGLNETIAKLRDQAAVITQKIEELSAQLSTQATRTRTVSTENLVEYQEALKQLNDNIAALEEQYYKLRSLIDSVNDQNLQLEGMMSQAETRATRLSEEAAAATTADALDQLTKQLEDVRQQLSSDGINVANTIGSNLNVIVYNLDILSDNISIVTRSASQLQTSVEADVTAIDSITSDGDNTVKRYDLQGHRINTNHRGIQIIKRNNGKTQVIFNR